jgi:hypothetical protein
MVPGERLLVAVHPLDNLASAHPDGSRSTKALSASSSDAPWPQ